MHEQLSRTEPMRQELRQLRQKYEELQQKWTLFTGSNGQNDTDELETVWKLVQEKKQTSSSRSIPTLYASDNKNGGGGAENEELRVQVVEADARIEDLNHVLSNVQCFVFLCV